MREIFTLFLGAISFGCCANDAEIQEFSFTQQQFSDAFEINEDNTLITINNEMKSFQMTGEEYKIRNLSIAFIDKDGQIVELGELAPATTLSQATNTFPQILVYGEVTSIDEK